MHQLSELRILLVDPCQTNETNCDLVLDTWGTDFHSQHNVNLGLTITANWIAYSCLFVKPLPNEDHILVSQCSLCCKNNRKERDVLKFWDSWGSVPICRISEFWIQDVLLDLCTQKVLQNEYEHLHWVSECSLIEKSGKINILTVDYPRQQMCIIWGGWGAKEY